MVLQTVLHACDLDYRVFVMSDIRFAHDRMVGKVLMKEDLSTASDGMNYDQIREHI